MVQNVSASTDAVVTCEGTTSSICSFIPSVLRSRLPAFAALHQSARNFITRPRRNSQPIPDGTCTTEGIHGSASRRSSVDTIVTYSKTDSRAPAPRVGSEHHDQNLVSPTLWDKEFTGTGDHIDDIDWNIAGVGVQIWLSARRQAELGAMDRTSLRSMHIDAIKYMKMALPDDLSEVETQTLQARLPSRMRKLDDNSQRTIVGSKPNLLRQSIAQGVCWISALLLLIIPLTMTVLNRLLVYEREHKITRRVLNNSAEAVKALGEKGLDLGDALIRFRDTPLGEAFLNMMAWLVEGVAGGVNDGLVQCTNAGPGPISPRR